VRIPERQPGREKEAERRENGWEPGQSWLAETTLGRIMFNDLLPADYPFINELTPKKRQGAIVNDLAERYSMTQVAATLDRLKDAGVYWATRSGVTLAMSDVAVPDEKPALPDDYDGKAEHVETRYEIST